MLRYTLDRLTLQSLSRELHWEATMYCQYVYCEQKEKVYSLHVVKEVVLDIDTALKNNFAHNLFAIKKL